MDPRLRTLRLARGMTLETLARKMGGIVTPMALSKYERGIHRPSPAVMERITSALGVRPEDLYGRSTIIVDFLKYRKRATFSKKEEEHVRNLIDEALQQRIRVQELVAPGARPALPRLHQVQTLEDAERAAEALRRYWDLGLAPIRDLTSTLESNLVHVLGVETSDKFDGLSSVARREGTGEVVGAAVVSRRTTSGERWRMNLGHELGHIAMEVAGNINEEKAAFRFASAFLAPAETLLAAVGRSRKAITAEELMDLRTRFGISMQALVYRLSTLGVITEDHTLSWWRFIAKRGWRMVEPGESEPERSTWLEDRLRRSITEEMITREEAEAMLGVERNLEITGPVPRGPAAEGEAPAQVAV